MSLPRRKIKIKIKKPSGFVTKFPDMFPRRRLVFTCSHGSHDFWCLELLVQRVILFSAILAAEGQGRKTFFKISRTSHGPLATKNREFDHRPPCFPQFDKAAADRRRWSL
jgi:hypothetical protein